MYKTDLELLDYYCETCLDLINPSVFRDIQRRGLYNYINHLPRNPNEAKAIVRARLHENKIYVGDPQIEQIAGVISRLTCLRDNLKKCNMTDVHITTPILEEMMELNQFVKDYFKPTKIS